MNMERDKITQSVYKFWNDRPCNIKHSSKKNWHKRIF